MAETAAPGPSGAPLPDPVARTSGRGRYLTSLVATVVGVSAVVGALQMGVGSAVEPGPGLWPLVAGLLLTGSGAVSTLVDVRAPDGPAVGIGVRVLLGIVGLAAYVLAFRSYGLLLPTPLFLLFWVRVVAGDGWRVAVATAVLGTAGFWLVFAVLLQVPLPIGPFGL